MSVKLTAMTCGWLSAPFGLFVGGAEGTLRAPVPAFLIEHPKGTVLFDSGMHPETGADKDLHIGPAGKHFTVHYEATETIAARLGAAERDARKIDYLVNSHLHFDHAGGNVLVPNARLVVQKPEWEAGHVPELMRTNGFVPLHYDLGHDRLEIEGEHDLFGDGSVVCIPTYGHTPGHQSLKVRLDDGDVILCGDACYMRKTLEELALPKFLSDPEGMLRSLRLLKDLEAKGARLIFGHDPDQWPQMNRGPLEALTAAAVAAAS